MRSGNFDAFKMKEKKNEKKSILEISPCGEGRAAGGGAAKRGGLVDVCTLGILNIEYRTCRTHRKTEHIRVHRLVFAERSGETRAPEMAIETRREFFGAGSPLFSVADFAIARARLFV